MLSLINRNPFMLDSRIDRFFSDWDSILYDEKYELTTDSKNGLNLKIKIPGYGREDLELSLEDNMLVIQSSDKKVNKKFIIPNYIDLETIEATCEKGVLSITANNVKKSEKKLITIK